MTSTFWIGAGWAGEGAGGAAPVEVSSWQVPADALNPVQWQASAARGNVFRCVAGWQAYGSVEAGVTPDVEEPAEVPQADDSQQKVSDTIEAVIEALWGVLPSEWEALASYTPPPPASALATGGTVVDVGIYRFHVFTASGTLTVTVPGPADALIVGGGGGGGTVYCAGGGGGAQVRWLTALDLTAGAKTVTVGNGGNETVAGQSSSFFGYTSVGGGRGGDTTQPAGGGAAGGGGGGTRNSVPGGTGTFAGGAARSGNTTGTGAGGGGGGNGGAGVTGAGLIGGQGGIGIEVPEVAAVPAGSPAGWFGGGGGGGSYTNSAKGPVQNGGGGLGGGLSGGTSPAPGTNGTANTGGGGGGSGGAGGAGDNTGGVGGSGIVIVRTLKP